MPMMGLESFIVTLVRRLNLAHVGKRSDAVRKGKKVKSTIVVRRTTAGLISVGSDSCAIAVIISRYAIRASMSHLHR